MKVDRELWRRRKELMYQRLMRDLHIGYLDEDIINVLMEIFRRDEAFTISSCSGRITLVDAPLPWMRRNSAVVFKKHKPISVEEIIDIINKPALSNLWLITTGPIIHVSTASLREARRILLIAREAGLKHSGVISMSSKGIIVELRSGVRLTQLIKVGGDLVINLSELSKVVNLSNEALLQGKERLKRLEESLIRHRE